MNTRELAIYFPDGSKRRVPLQGQRITLGRSSDNDLAYPDDPVLSRRHLVFGSNGSNWYVEDLNTTNGTLVNGLRLAGRQELTVGDTISAGRLTLAFGVSDDPGFGVAFVEDEAPHPPAERGAGTAAHTVEAIGGSSPVAGTSRVQALLDAGREISGERPLGELFHIILDLAISAVGASRGVIMTFENAKLVPRAMRGTGFRISMAVRDRVVKDKESILILDASRHEVLRSSTTIQHQRVRSLMAVPLKTEERVLGLIYVDSQDEVRFFLHEDLTLLTLMANMAAIRIDQAR